MGGGTLRSGCPIRARAHPAGAIFVTFRDGSGVIPSPNLIRNRPLPIDLCGCSDRVDGLKGIANWGGNLGPVYFETHGEGEWGKKRYRLIGPEELAEIQAQQAAATRLHPLDVLARAFDGRLESGASVTITKVRENVARLSEISPATAREPADEVVQAWHREGWAIVSDSGSGSARRVAITLTAEGVQAAKERGTL